MQCLDVVSTGRLARHGTTCVVIALAISACAAFSKKEEGAVIGAGTGAAVGVEVAIFANAGARVAHGS